MTPVSRPGRLWMVEGWQSDRYDWFSIYLRDRGMQMQWRLATSVFTMFLGAVGAFVAARRRGPAGDVWVLPLASGRIAGEALVAIIIPMLIVLGVMSAH